MSKPDMLRIAEEYMRDNKELFDALGAEKPIDTSCLPKNDVVDHLLKSLPKTDIGMAEQIDIIGRIAHDHPKEQDMLASGSDPA